MSVDAFDTNVLVYACDKSDVKKRSIAQGLLDSDDGIILWQVACEFIAASRTLSEQGFTPADAWRHLGLLLDSLPLVVPRESVLDRARVLQVDSHWSFWDALIVGACIEANVSRLFTEDVPGHKSPEGLEIINPFA